MLTEIVGWASSLVLIATIARQIHKQWRAGSSDDVSNWLFVGQLASSLGFTAYSVMVGNWVFVATNAVMALSAIAGMAIVHHHRRRAGSGVTVAAE